MNTQTINSQVKHPFDLEDRSSQYGKSLLEFVKSLPLTDLTRPLIVQLIRSGTSIGANYMEADGAESKKDFRHIIARCKKEAKETRYWLHMIAVMCPEKKEDLRVLWKEAEELTRIFATILMK